MKSPQIIYYPDGCLESYEEFKETAEGKRKPSRNYIYFRTISLYPNCAPKGIFPGAVTDTIIATSSDNGLSMDKLLPMRSNNPMKRASNPMKKLPQ